MRLPLSMWGVELVAFFPPKKKMQVWLLQTRSCVINLFFPSVKHNLFICLLLFFEQVNFGRLSFFSPRRTARSGGQNLGALIKNVAGVPARQTSATGAVEKRLFFYIYIIIYLSLHPTLPTPHFHQFFTCHSVGERPRGPYQGGRKCACALMCEGVNECTDVVVPACAK